MSVSEYQRHQLFQWFEESMGPERAATMMEVLPPVNWTEVATKSDLHAMRGEIAYDIAKSTRSIYFALVASQATLVGLVLAAVRLG